MKGTIKEMIYCRARFGAMLRRRGGAYLEVNAMRSLTYCYK